MTQLSIAAFKERLLDLHQYFEEGADPAGEGSGTALEVGGATANAMWVSRYPISRGVEWDLPR